MYPTKIFVRESSVNAEPPVSQKAYAISNISSYEAQSFYENVVNSEPQAARKSHNVKASMRKTLVKTQPKPPPPDARLIFKLAQDNNYQELSRLIESGIDVNVRDNYGWTSLMCASCSGAEECVRLLLKFGADINVSSSGYDAKDLAIKNHHNNIVKILNESNLIDPNPSTSTAPKISSNFCIVCGENYTSSRRKHESSTVHLLTTATGKSRTYYGIPESNKGFQILKKTGWDPDKGLGPDGTGRKLPVKAKEKHNRRGIGAADVEKKNISRDARSAVKPPVKSARRKDQDFERNFRSEFL